MMSLFANFLSYITSPIYSLISTPTWFFSAPGKIWGLSVPWRVAVFTGLLLSVLVSVLIFGQTHRWFGDEQIFNVEEHFGRTLALIAVLVIAFSVGIGFATHFWLMEVASRFPLIDEAWKTGIAELRANGIDITDVPLFLVLGVPDTPSANAMMQASGLTLGVKPNESGTKPLLWYTAERNGNVGIFLFLTSCCQTSLMSSGRGLVTERGGKEAPANQLAGQTIQGGLQSYDFGGMQSMQLVNDDSGYSDSGVVPYNESAMHSIDGDFEPRKPARPQPAAMRTIDDMASVDLKAKPEMRSESVQLLGQPQAKLAKEQLQHVCRRLLAARQPYCPCNGVIATVPFQMLRADGEKQGKYLGEATRADLTTMTSELGLRSHAIAVVHGLDSDDDFRVFIKRMRDFQSSADIERRLGKGVSTWVDFNGETIESVTACACDAFQRLIYKFFSSTQSIKKVDNGQLYRFLAKIRGNVVGNLSGWLTNGFAPQDEQDGKARDLESLPQFAGCYFVAAQPQSPDSVDEDRLFAHVPGLFEKVFELESEIEWTGDAIARDNAYSYTANVFFLLTLTAIAIAVVGFFGIAGFINWPFRA